MAGQRAEQRAASTRGDDAPVLVACAHGTRNADGRAVMNDLRSRLGAARPGLEVSNAHLDVHGPYLPDVVAGLAAQGRRMVIVPLLLSAGYHVHVDVAAAVDLAGGLAVATPPLGPDAALTRIVIDRIGATDTADGDTVVLAAAGSSDPRAVADVERVVADIAADRPAGRIVAAYLSAARPRAACAVAAARIRGERVTVATYLLAPGYFATRLPLTRADAVTEPLAPDERLVALALARYDDAVRTLGTPSARRP